MTDNGKYSSSDEKPFAYDESHIRHITNCEHVRMRPGMYIGGTGLRALHAIIDDVLEYSIEDALAGRCTEVILTLKDNQEITIQDNGQGLPVHIIPARGQSALEILMTKTSITADKLHNLRSLEVPGGSFGVGIAAVNALSEWMVIETVQEGKVWGQSYQAGVPQTPVQHLKHRHLPAGTVFTFRPDFSILQVNEFHFRTLARRCFELAYLIPNLRVTLRNKREGSNREVSYFAAEGTKTFIENRFQQRQPLHPIIHARQNVVISTRHDSYELGVEFALLFTRRQRPLVMSYANTTFTQYGGTHQEGLLDGILAAINENYPDTPFTRQQIKRGLIAILSIRHPDPQFESQRKISLMNPDAYDAVFQFVRDSLRRHKAEWLPAVLEKLRNEDKPDGR